MSEQTLPAAPNNGSLPIHIDSEVIQGEVTDDIARNPQGEILDSDGKPLLQQAAINVATAQGIHSANEQLAELDTDRLKNAQNSLDIADVNESVKSRRDTEQAALWRSQRHYNANPKAYHQAALEEDEQRSKEKPQPELPPPSN